MARPATDRAPRPDAAGTADNTVTTTIAQHFQAVADRRRERAADPARQAAVDAVKAFQAERFRNTYPDLLGSERFGPAARFFLDELYGPQDFSTRDQEFQRVIPAATRLLPHELLDTVRQLAELHALSEALDDAMAARLGAGPWQAADYAGAWRALDRPADRRCQIEWTVRIGRSLERYTRHAVIGVTLRMMRGPARAAGLGAMQRMLETGFSAFAHMGKAADFLAVVEQRETAFAQRMEAGLES